MISIDDSMTEKGKTGQEAPIRRETSPLSPWRRVALLAVLCVFSVMYFPYLLQGAQGIKSLYGPQQTSHLAQARRILEHNPLIDGHNDLLIHLRTHIDNGINDPYFQERFKNGSFSGEVDLLKIKEGKYGGAFWSAYYICQQDLDDYSDAAYDSIVKATLQQLDLYGRLAELFPEHFPTTPSGRHYSPNPNYARQHFKSGHLISPLGIEGLHQIGNSPSTLRLYHALGVRYSTLTWNCHNVYADAALLTRITGRNASTVAAPPLHHGLSKRGRSLVLEMNRLGMLVDLSHVSEDTMIDALVGREDAFDGQGQPWKGSLAPPMFSHSSIHALCPHPRNVPDHVLSLVQQRNSIVMINFTPDFISCTAPTSLSPDGLPVPEPEHATLERVIEHIMYVGEKIGYDHVGIGTDYDGMDSTPAGLEDVSKMPHLVAELLRRNVTEQDVVKIVGGNILRVWGQADQIGRELRAKGMLPLEDEEVHSGW